VAEIMDAGHVGEPGILWWAGDQIEALWRVGDVGAARRRQEELRAQAERTDRRWARAVAARTGGLLAATDDEAEQAFAEAVVWHRALDIPFERARTLLCLGERRRAAGRGDAEGPLREALGTFRSLGAQPWAAQALALLGERRQVPEQVPLTKQEREVAGLVGRGSTNREAADHLYVSPRTIDFHLRNIYKKLGVRSRTELARVLAGAPEVHRRRRTDRPPT
jgi:DNA-binding CsgD family transcriptional regulator